MRSEQSLLVALFVFLRDARRCFVAIHTGDQNLNAVAELHTEQKTVLVVNDR